MSERGSPSDHTVTGIEQTKGDAPASASPVVEASPGGTDANKSPADNSSPPADTGATKDTPKPTLLEVLKTAAALPDDPGKSPAPPQVGKDNVDPAAPAQSDKDKAAAQDDSKLSFHNHPRWQEVIGQNKQLRDQVHTLEPDADQFRKIQGFMGEHHLTPDEVGEGFIIMAMAKNGDPRVIQKLDEFRNKVALAIGEAVPADIQAKIESGEISEGAGKELAKSRATLKLTETREAERSQQQALDEQTRAREAAAWQQASAVSAWEKEQRKVDPDFAGKEKAIARYSRALMQEHGMPKTPEQALTLVKAAYAEVTKDFAASLPPKARVARVPVAPSSNGAKPAPKTLREVVEQAAAMN